MRIAHNLAAMNADRMFGITKAKNKDSVEKLSSGYKINRAADDAAGLAISEKMRRLIRGLNQGTANAEDGVSWTQIGDGALNEAHAIIHRMTELTVKALNGTNTESDRMALEMEFEALQSELDRIGTTTEFNKIPIFDQHEIPYYQCEGSAKWDPQQMHVVTAGENDLTFTYRMTETDAPKTVTVTVPAGEYTTQELIDEVETALGTQNTGSETVVLEFTKDGYCNANVEGAEAIDSVSGGLSYLVYDMYKGGSYGALIGTTNFPDETSRLKVVSGQNDSMSFSIESFSGGNQTKTITIPSGSYTRSELIDILNNQLSDTTVKATAYGSGIKLSSDDAIVTGFKGNMFKIDGSGTIYNSIFYDNVKYGSVSQQAATLTGGYVLPTDSRDVEHKYYRIDSGNNILTLQPNQSANPVTITIPDGEYTATEMATKLNELFTAAGVTVTASRISSGGFEGIKLTSNLKGPDSKINMDTTSSAYNTLFVTREYNYYGSKVYPINETTANREAVFKGSKDLSGLSTTPLTVTAGTNDSFTLSITSGTTTTDYTITLSAKTYSSLQEVQTELDAQLNGSAALAGYKGKVTVSTEGNKLVLTGTAGQNIDKIRVKAVSGNTGFDNLFQGYSSATSTPTASGTGSVTLNTPFDGTIDSSESNMTIKVDGTNYPVTLPTGNVTKDEIINAIETAIPPKTVTTENKFSTVSASGTNSNRNFSKTASGTQSVTSWSDSAQGNSTEKEGVVGFITNTPATLTIGPSLKSSMEVTSSNNVITLSLNGVTKSITLEEGTYTPESLKTALQNGINQEFGTGMGSATVSLDGNKLVLTSVLPDGFDGKDTSISCSTGTSSFLKELNTARSAAVWSSSNVLASDIAIDDSNQSFVFQYKENGSTQSINLTLSKGNYSQSTIVSEINAQLAKTGTGITASLSSGKLTLTSADVGSGVSITYSTTTGGASAEELFGPLNTPGPANVVVNLKTEDSIKIEQGVSDTFTITVNGTAQTVTLDSGTYDRGSFVTMLNDKLTEANAGVQAYVSGNKLGYKTTATGTSASLNMSYAAGGNSMKAIYGVTTTEYSGVEVSFDANNNMVLGTTKPGSSISVAGTSGGAFQQPVVTLRPISTSYTDGYHSAKTSYIDGVTLSGDVTIDQWNNNLSFTYLKDGVSQSVSVEIPDGKYTFADLETKLQELLDAEVGSNQIEATVSSGGVRLEAVNTGNKYQFNSFSGDFYDKVICSCSTRSYAQTAKEASGSQTVDTAYTVGRKDVKTGTTTIRNGISDELALDLTYGNTVHNIKVTLDAGEYTGDSLKQHLQQKINEQLAGMGLPENLIQANIGGISTGVYGSNDQNALNFSLSKTIQAPAEGQFVIDGVRGSAAFEIFYQTDGTMEPAYIMGNKDVSEGVAIDAGETDLSFIVDGVQYSITIPEGEYTGDEILDTLNNALDAAGAPVVVETRDGMLKLTHRKLGNHDISDVSGGAKKTLFFGENGETEALTSRYVQLSSEVNDKIPLNRHIFNTVYLGINSCCISRPKYAEKALVRLEAALQKISAIRSDFGSTQNRLEHAIANNENKAENLQSAESVIRDTDMAKEMVEYSKHNILQQAGQAMLSHANQSYQGVMNLLQ